MTSDSKLAFPLNLPQHNVDIHPALLDAIEVVNKAAIELWLTASLVYKIAPLTGAFVGLSDDALEELSKVRKPDLIRASRVGVSLAIPRFSDAASIRTILGTGFSEASMMAEITKGMTLSTLEKKRRTV